MSGTRPARGEADEKRAFKPRGVLRFFAVFGVSLAVWEALVRLDAISSLVLAPPSSIVQAARQDGAQFLAALGTTAYEIFLAVLISWGVGIVLGLLIGILPFVRDVLTPLLDGAFAIPWVILYPLLLAWFGIGSPSKIAFGVIFGVLPVMLSTISGIRSIEARYFLLARSFNASRRDTLTKICVPLALPSIVSGLRIGAGLAIIAVIVGEMLGSTEGIGYLIGFYETQLYTGHVYLGLLLALLFALAGNAFLGYLERRVPKAR